MEPPLKFVHFLVGEVYWRLLSQYCLINLHLKGNISHLLLLLAPLFKRDHHRGLIFERRQTEYEPQVGNPLPKAAFAQDSNFPQCAPGTGA